MVFILDEGSKFKAPMAKVWELNASEGKHAHPSLKNQKIEQVGSDMILSYQTQNPDGTWATTKTRTTAYPPVGVAFEVLEGPLAGSKSFQYYTPKGNETAVTVVGEFVGKGLPDAVVKQAVMGFLDTVFNEDQKNLSKM